MPKCFARAALLFLIPLAALNAQVLDGIRVKDSGMFEIHGMEFALTVFGDGWSSASQSPTTIKANAGYPKKGAGTWELQGTFTHPKSGAFRFVQTMKRVGDGKAEFAMALDRDAPVKVNSISIALSLPLAAFKGKKCFLDGEAVALPEAYEKGKIGIVNKECKTLSIPVPTGKLTITGDLKVLVQDNREWGEGPFSVRLSFKPDAGEVQKAAIAFTLASEGLDSRPLDLRAAANMGLADQESGDQKGGWTDQGAENDLRALKPGNLILGGIKFTVADPAANQGKSILAFAGPSRPYFLKEATLAGDGKPAAWLYLLHASAWTPESKAVLGVLKLKYSDGSSAERSIASGIDVGNWWSPVDLRNGLVAWNATNASSFVGLYLSRFAVDKPVASVTFAPTGKGVWMVVGASLSTDTVDFSSVNTPVYVAAGPAWAPITHARATEKGSILDLSFLQKETGVPAGQYGPLVIKNGKFEFAKRPGVRVRFNGGNTCFSANYLEKAEADAFAEYVASLGHNALRIHHYEREMMDPAGPPGEQRVRESELAKLDYLIHALKSRGVYITTDVFVSRPCRKGDLPGVNEAVDMSSYKALVLLGPAREDWKKWAKWFFVDHVNPNTGLALGKDPVLMTLSLVNEDNLDACWDKCETGRRVTLEKFAAWLSAKGLEEGKGGERAKRFAWFLVETHTAAVKEMVAYLKSIGIQTPTTDANMIDSPRWIGLRKDLEFVDTHGYWDHPQFPEGAWRMPYGFHNRQPLKSLCSMPGVQGGTRVLGKPFTVTEYQYVYPNPYRAEGTAMAATFACLQDWDGLFRFALSHNRKNLVDDATMSGFDIVVDPIHLLGERMVSLVFLRGDVKSAPGALPFVVDQNYYAKGDGASGDGWAPGFPNAYWQLGWVTRIGSAWAEYKPKIPGIKAALTPQSNALPSLPGAKTYRLSEMNATNLAAEGLLGAGAFDPATLRTRSETGEVEIDAAGGTMKVASPRFEALVLPDKGALSGSALAAKSLDGYGVLYLASMDGAAIAKSRRLLFLHLTDVSSQKLKYRSRSKNLVEDWGSPQRVVAAGSMDISIKTEAAADLKLWGCDLSGKRVEELPLKKGGGSVSFTAETVKDGKARFVVYELGKP
ncbi:MAG: hypothetical protein J0L75_06975 [Spirochaetes bacterium]|nr:hypothetical protein [Spirochaetota bacterium]